MVESCVYKHITQTDLTWSLGLPRAYARTRGLGLTYPLWVWYVTKSLLPAQRILFVFVYFCLLICRLNANNTEWICMQISRSIVNGPKSNILGFGGNLGSRLHPGTISPLFADLSPTTHVYDCVTQLFTLFETIVFILSAMADQRMRWPVWLHYQFL